MTPVDYPKKQKRIKLQLLILSILLSAFACTKKPVESTDIPTITPAITVAPKISAISSQSVKTDHVLIVPFRIDDPDSSLSCDSSVAINISDITKLPLSSITKGGTAPNCTLTITPANNEAVSTQIELTVVDSDSLSSNTNFTVQIIPIVSVNLNKPSLSMAVGGTSKLSITASYEDNTTGTVADPQNISWTSSSPAIAKVDLHGLVTGLTSGDTVINGQYKSFTLNSNIHIVEVQSVTVSVGAVSGGIGSQRSINLTAQTNNSSFDVTASADWNSSDETVATVTNGVINFIKSGSAIITASYGSYSTPVRVTVANKTLSTLTISMIGGSSHNGSAPVNGVRKLQAVGTYTDASTEDLTKTANWSSSQNTIAVVSNEVGSNGDVTTLSAGSVTLTAAVGSLNGQFDLTVQNVTLSSIQLTPDNPLVTSNGQYQMRAIGTYSDGSTAEITELATWSSNNSAAATVSNTATQKGLTTTKNVSGYLSTTISASYQSVSGNTLFGVNGATINSIILTPTISLMSDDSYNLKSYANLSDGGVIDLTPFSVWFTADSNIASVSNVRGSQGLVTGINSGATNISAAFNGTTGVQSVTVGATTSITEIGVGLTAEYFNWTGTSPPPNPFATANKKGQRIDSKILFNWAAGNAPMGVADRFAVRWTGKVLATSANNYFCLNSDDGSRIWINNVLVVNSWKDQSATWACSSNINLTVGQKYSVRMEFYENSGDSTAYLTRSSISATDAQSAGKAIPQSQLFSE